MPSAPDIIADAVERALGAPAHIKPCADLKFGDYQANGVMAIAKQRGENPRALAEKVIAQLQLGEICEPPTVAGAGFINFRLKPDFVAKQIQEAAADARLGVPLVDYSKPVVMDFSSPNVAKPMHVGHIRSTIIGDCLARVMRFLGHRVITDNHIGDWGTQFGVLIAGLKAKKNDKFFQAGYQADPIGALEQLYKDVSNWMKDPITRTELGYDAREEVVKLQRGDPENRAIWQEIIDLSRQEFEKTYRRLGVAF